MLSPDQEQFLFTCFPNLYRDKNLLLGQRGLLWGFEIGCGWFHLLNAASAKLEALILAEPIEKRDSYRAIQVKSKFGGLRLYQMYSTPEMDEAIRIAENTSFQTCEMCGDAGTNGSIGNWIWTLCASCKEIKKIEKGL